MIGGLETDAGESVTHRSWNIDCRLSRCVCDLDSEALPPLNLLGLVSSALVAYASRRPVTST
jgi:hypothetical protein